MQTVTLPGVVQSVKNELAAAQLQVCPTVSHIRLSIHRWRFLNQTLHSVNFTYDSSAIGCEVDHSKVNDIKNTSDIIVRSSVFYNSNIGECHCQYLMAMGNSRKHLKGLNQNKQSEQCNQVNQSCTNGGVTDDSDKCDWGMHVITDVCSLCDVCPVTNNLKVQNNARYKDNNQAMVESSEYIVNMFDSQIVNKQVSGGNVWIPLFLC